CARSWGRWSAEYVDFW
nr:immunoglobulin heavy chain junction region [Macaca mulatta]MOX63434.1 immunoglobulin heavy chain junction region [Macaca mulatta]MOX63907.1 immunoglobulin heavy chain junction region [Macaca mulatta]MOX65682.1 immunoglobulin heavy chain junction region [Macaca mulatta]MOX66043.1 immunoglobulin heavy chain junction region [Macaca mulatta]